MSEVTETHSTEKQIVRIMQQSTTAKTSPQLWLAMVLAFTLAAPVRGQAPQSAATSPAFEVASIKPSRSDEGMVRLMFSPDGFTGEGVPAKMLIGFAYEMKDFQISGGPGWIESERFSINAKMDEATIETLKKLPPEQAMQQRRLMMRGLLAERFQLKVSQANKELPIYSLIVSKSGAKLSRAADPQPASGPPSAKSMMRMRPGELTATAIPMSTLADRLSREVGRQVVDKTGLQGQYDFTLHWTPEQQGPVRGAADGGPDAAASPDSTGPSIFTAIQEQLGLKLESEKGSVGTIVIDHIEKPSAN